MRKATDKEINDFIKYRSNHVALVQRIGRVVFDEDFSDHDHDKIEADGEKLNLYALRNAMLNGNYQAHGDDKKALALLAGEHVCSQPHHPEYWCTEITPKNFDDSNPPQCRPSRMTDRRIVEMCADWSAVALKKNQPLFKWYNKVCTGPDSRFLFTNHQRDLIVKSIQKIIDAIDKEHLEYPGIKYTAEQVEPKTDDESLKESLDRIIERSSTPKTIYDDPHYADIVHSSSFKEWFGDWENDPEHSSQLCGSHGPRVFYHHSPSADIKEFKIGKNTCCGMRGIFFSAQSNGNLSSKMGDNLYKVFLNVRNPKLAYGSKDGYADRLRKMQENSDDILKTNEEFIEETGVDGFIDAFNGWIIVLTPNQIKQFESEADRIIESEEQIYTDKFKAWFGDWENDPEHSSKVVRNGRPLVMGHETYWDMSKDDYTFDRSKTEHDCHFFASYASRPGYEYGDKRYQVYLNIRNPKYLHDKIYPFACQFEDDGEHDGVIWIDPDDDSRIVATVYNSNQIKSATDNNGEFSPKSNRIIEDDCGGVCGVGMSAGFQAMTPEHKAELGDGSGLIDPSGKLKLTEENITGNVLKHMTHSEDLILLGRSGSMLLLKTFKDIFNALKGNNPTSRITQKIDGAPAVIAATDFHGKKFVALKHSWDNGRIFQSVGEIRATYADRPDLCAKLEYLFNELDAINIPKDEIWHGDFLYHIDDIRETSIDGKDYIIFCPNTLVYAIPKSDPLADKILDSVIGVAWHTKYTGETDNFKEVRISFDVSVSSVNDVPEVYQMDARIPSLAGRVTMTAEETDDAESKLNSLELLVYEITADDGYEALVYNETLTLLINTYRNHIIKDSNNQFPDVQGLKDWITGRYDAEKEKKKTDKGKSAVETRKQEILGAVDDALMSKIFEAQKLATELKEMFITKLNSLSGMKSFVNHISQGYISTSGEGFAVSDVDGNVYKLVSRLEFSRNNFSKEIIKGWQSERRMNDSIQTSALRKLRIR